MCVCEREREREKMEVMMRRGTGNGGGTRRRAAMRKNAKGGGRCTDSRRKGRNCAVKANYTESEPKLMWEALREATDEELERDAKV